ncbi:MAG: amino acid adenylation domain-containing protein [Hormoscilla sp. GUM202]|nr:amino acid adenylation domain-containing protein [Hormoscilla sp. GUM202]
MASTDEERAMGKQENLVELLVRRALIKPESTAYIWLQDGEKESDVLSYLELDSSSRAIASHLQSICQPGERALLLYPPGLEFIPAFFGCLYAGVVAVPAYPPKGHQKTSRLQAIASSAGATVALTTSSEVIAQDIGGEGIWVLPVLHSYSGHRTGVNSRLKVIATDILGSHLASDCQVVGASPDTLAFLQYTSGSTGKPKGVMVSHGNLLHNLEMLELAFGHSDKTVGVNWLPLFHDMGLIGKVLEPLYVGLPCIHMSPGAFLQKPIRWLQAIARYKATTSGGPSFAYDLCVNKITPEEKATLDLSSWEVAFNGAEPVRSSTLERFSSTFADCGFRREAFYPCYGMAEATVFVSGGVTREPPVLIEVSGSSLEQNLVVTSNGETRDKREIVSCGRAWLDEKIAIVDPESLTQCPDNQVGEIWVSSSSVAMGYWRKPEQTEETFKAYLADTGEGPFLRTGDLGFLQDGELFVTGRLKDLIIIRGRNYYPQDIESTVEQSHPSLRANCSAAFSVEVDGSERVVVAAEVERQALKGLDVDAVVESIRSAIWWEYELQVYGVLLLKTASIPKTSSGKIQRHACRQGFKEGSLQVVGNWQQGEQENRKLPLFPTESLETWLAKWIGRSLGVAAESIDPNKSLFYYGLDSVTAMQLATDLEELLGSQVSPSVAWDYPTIVALTRYLREERTLSVWTPTVAHWVGEKAECRSEFPLSSGQKALWFLYKLAPESWAYNILLAVRIRSQIDVVAFRGALQALVSRHQILRTSYIERDGEPRQRIIDDFDLPWTQIDGSCWNAEELKARVTDDGRRPFNLEESAFRVSLFTREASDHVLLLAAHHIASDFWSMLVLMDELKVLYTVPEKSAQKSPEGVFIPPLPLSYTDWMGDQNSMLAGSRGEELWNYWRQELGGALDVVLDLPTDKPRPPVKTYNGATHSFKITQELTRQLQGLAQESEATLYTLLLAAFIVLLYRYTGQEDIMVGSPTSGRTRRELSNIVGYLVNPVVLRADMSGNPTFAESIARVRSKVAGAIAHQEYPFGLLVEKLQPQRAPSRSPLFDVMFVLQQPQRSEELAQLLYSPGKHRSIEWGELELGDFEITQYEGQFDLTLETILASGALGGAFKYNTDLFDSGTISRMAGHFQVLLEAIASNPEARVDQLPLLSELERHQLLVEWNDTANKYPSDKCIHELFYEQVERNSDAVAVVFEESQLTYRELNSRANKLAHYLRSLGVGPEVLVGICVERSIEMVVGLLSILKAGGAYVPLDPAYPPERIAYMLSDAQVSVLLTQSNLLSDLTSSDALVVCLDVHWGAIASWNEENPANFGSPDNLAYIIYTSGSTGKPKGVEVTHRGIVRLLFGVDYVNLSPRSKILHMAPISFDASTFEIWGALLHGSECVLYPTVVPTPKDLRNAISKHGITTIWLTAALFNSIVDDDAEALLGIGQLLTGGEALSVAHVRKAMEYLPSVQIINGYGPTENTTFTCCYQIDRLLGESVQSIDIGRPIGNTQVYILDNYLQPVPIGVPGELYIGGAGLARGYLNRPSLTLSSFIPNPFSDEPGARLYKTGDMARYRRDGNIEFLGRIDNQVKIRGFRIELGEIEATLAQHPDVVQAVVIAREDIPGDKRLVAYIVAKGAPPTVLLLRDFLKAKLPEYMVPAAFVTLEAMPLTPNGKVDRRALPAPDPSFITSAETFVGPRTPTEEILAAIWSKILGNTRVGIHDNFFELGGDSILTIGIISQAARAGLKITPKQMFQHQTIASLADVATVVTQTEKIAQQERVTGVVPLTPIQHWFFDQKLPEPHHYNQSVLLEVSPDSKPERWQQAVEQMNSHHDALRLRFALGDGKIEQINASEEKTVPFNVIDLSEVSEQQAAITQTASGMQRSLNLSEGPLMQAALFNLGIDKPGRLLLVIHHLAVDGVSWRILLEDLVNAYRGNKLPQKTTSFQDWAVRLTEYAEEGISPAEQDYWRAQSGSESEPLPVDYENMGANTVASTANVSICLTVAETRALLKEVPQAYNTQINDVLLTALVQSFYRWTGKPELLVDLEGHGREQLFSEVDLSRTVGWFTTIFPVRLKLENSDRPSEALKSVKEQLRKIPQRGIGYGIQRYLRKKSHGDIIEATPQAEVSFNYLGQFDQMVGASPLCGFAKESPGQGRSQKGLRKHLLEVNSLVKSGELQVNWTYSENFHKHSTVEGLARGFREALKSLIAHCSDAEAGGYTPSDFAKVELRQAEIDELLLLAEIED